MRHVAYAVAVALLLTVPLAASVSAEMMSMNAEMMPEGGLFGLHVAGMAPEHATAHGRDFGECVSEMAITGECTHHEGM